VRRKGRLGGKKSPVAKNWGKRGGGKGKKKKDVVLIKGGFVEGTGLGWVSRGRKKGVGSLVSQNQKETGVNCG